MALPFVDDSVPIAHNEFIMDLMRFYGKSLIFSIYKKDPENSKILLCSVISTRYPFSQPI